jgi:hypothetical protein
MATASGMPARAPPADALGYEMTMLLGSGPFWGQEGSSFEYVLEHDAGTKDVWVMDYIVANDTAGPQYHPVN